MKQWALKCALTNMKSDWKTMELETVPLEAEGTYLLNLSSVDAIQVMLDAHLMETHKVRSSPFAKPIEKEVKDWELRLIYMQDVLQEWVACQRGWLHLEPIFASEDVQKMLATESKRFTWVGNLWRTTMEQLVENPIFMDISDVIDNLLQNFTEANSRLEKVMKGLSEYFETKRKAFPRFYFLSNAELLEVLGIAKTPQKVQPFVSRVFPGLSALVFNAEEEIT